MGAYGSVKDPPFAPGEQERVEDSTRSKKMSSHALRPRAAAVLLKIKRTA
jgi:hypothetical protein